MSLNVNMRGDGTHAGVRKPWVGGHGPKCICSKCNPAPAVIAPPRPPSISTDWQQS